MILYHAGIIRTLPTTVEFTKTHEMVVNCFLPEHLTNRLLCYCIRVQHQLGTSECAMTQPHRTQDLGTFVWTPLHSDGWLAPHHTLGYWVKKRPITKFL